MKRFIILQVLVLLIATIGPVGGHGDEIEDRYREIKQAPLVFKMGHLGYSSILDIHPTQILFGEREAVRKEKKFKKMDEHEVHEYLLNNPVPVVVGPRDVLYMVDHHHLSWSLKDLGYSHVIIKIVGLDRRSNTLEFWKNMITRHWVYPFEEGATHQFTTGELETQLPSNVLGLRDDPYRSLAGFVKEAGGYEKDPSAYFIEFKWAEFFRSRISIEGDTDADFKKAVRKAVDLAQSEEAVHMPGYIGSRAVHRVGQKSSCTTLLTQ